MKIIQRNYLNKKSPVSQAFIEQIHKLISIRAIYILIELGEIKCNLIIFLILGGFAFWSYIKEINQRLILELNKSLSTNEEKQALMIDISSFFQNFLLSPSDTETHISSKCEVLINLLLERFNSSAINEEMTAIIFVSKRFLAKYMKILLQNYVESNNLTHMKIDYIIGHHSVNFKQRPNSDDFVRKIEDLNEVSFAEKDILNEVFSRQLLHQDLFKKTQRIPNLIDMRFKLSDQIKTLQSFRKKNINILISTSVTEEGLDIPECNLVISFSEPKTIKSFIQLKGRARKEKSEYLILVSESKVKNLHKKNIIFFLKFT